MALSPDDVDALGKLLDQRLEAHGKLIDQKLDERERRARSRRRIWFWFWVLFFIGSSLASWWTARKLLSGFQDQIAALENDTLEAKIAYQQQLAKDRQMQRERAAVEQATGYRSEQNQADFDAGLIRQAFQLMGKSAEVRAKQQKPAAGASAEDDLDKSIQDIGAMTDQMSTMLGQLLLHETDPAHNGRVEHLATGDTGGKPADKPNAAIDQQLQQLQEPPLPAK